MLKENKMLNWFKKALGITPKRDEAFDEPPEKPNTTSPVVIKPAPKKATKKKTVAKKRATKKKASK